ncbi:MULTISPECIES: 3-hydroxyacyl-CoA dehydrogenase NAD-binding domain-containing protein [Streptomyces]|uniref:3-hydroxyacyl-CoA dehydrogenase n=1 Tax=Streptomyces tsukubensis (strain DSM 42081 / NBRC 108919 / NRRL 18488 / 9993) TaxID=1114943 RepID=I2N9J1_STRT9|nr:MULTISPECIES: 3-hydroxyacyl-CoA dehydrogenase NAD-binding domain-containing protein [Streptomyces]AZK97526.1 3-hydroxyacyl-CoA dehydrogenase [Streptomyces tsukubensis]EIF93688.1 fatty acid oxidation complex alpha-subunit [Streptomyces tsukubensis NRRL18488]MYS68032.1 3-hydroxyacyl-CoA dehydrogenase [Streptomyces sp. SID5473]QKM66528.1 3-hydroxyacyl-CoA dehydrogenase [Streptomyces tsukubensis NRRL18488]TAI45130.1 3-hydroxyacyl-CoA dehydrogenase [Streptomyces tsukubensis]
MTTSTSTTGQPPLPDPHPARPSSAVIRWEADDTGVVTLVLDDPGQSANTMNQAFRTAITAVAERAEAERDSIRGIIVTSAKKTFFAGGDLKDMIRIGPGDARQAFDAGMAVKHALRRIETLGKPVVAAINGTALGGGYEIALACHHRIALDAPGSRIGLPEVTLGLLPAAGGVTRTVRLLGIADALLKVLLQGTRHTPRRALENGLVHELAATPEDMLAKARAFIDAHPESRQPWDEKGYRIPGGTPATPRFAADLPAYPANLKKQTGGAPYPAPRNILAAAVEGSQVDFETAQTIEARYFTELVTGQTAKNMIQAFFFDLQAVNTGAGRPPEFERRTVAKVAVLGAGMMGAGIAYACARAGIDVVLKDVSAEAAGRGRAYSVKLLDKAVARGRTTEAERDAVLARITPTADLDDLAGCDAVIEAVFEDTGLKHRVFQEVQDVVAPDALLCSNTSTLPIGALAEGVARPADFIGLHFFSPVDKMPLVEIIRGRETGDEALARAFDLVRQLNKTPIVVNDSRGFFTSRVIGRFINEGVAMVGEGIDPASVEQAAAQAGYPAKVLSLMDELTLTLPRRIRGEARRATEEAGGIWVPHPADAVVDRMVDEFGRTGRAGGAGFYDYGDDGARTGLWPGLREHFTRPDADVPFVDLQERMLFSEALDSVRCLEENVLTSVAEANIGSVMGIGFPAWTGGVLQYINGYEGGLPGFTARARELAARYGERFEPPALLVAKAERGDRFTDGEG